MGYVQILVSIIFLLLTFLLKIAMKTI